MSQHDETKRKIKDRNANISYRSAKSLLESLGFKEYTKGRTSGSRVKFYRPSDGKMTTLHKPHPDKDLKSYVVDDLKEFLEELGEL